jgi:hypothetical protein
LKYSLTNIYLNSIEDTGALHPGRHIDRVAPDVILRLGLADHARHHWTNIDTDSQLELVEAVAVYRVQNLHHGEGEVGQSDQILIRSLLYLNFFFEFLKIICIEKLFKKIDSTFLSASMFRPAAAM